MRELVNETGKKDDQFRRDAEVKLGIPLFPDMSWVPEDTPKFPVNPKPSAPTIVELNQDSSSEIKQVIKQSGQTISVCAEFVLWQEVIGGYFPKGNSSPQTEYQWLYWGHGWCEYFPNYKKGSIWVYYHTIQVACQ